MTQTEKYVSGGRQVRASLLVPCYNEEDVLPLMLNSVRRVMSGTFADDWELVLVDDGSSDRTAEMIREAANKDSHVRGVILSRNFGHQAALATGLQFCRGRIVGIIDCDLQDPVDILMVLFQKVDKEGYDIAYGVRKKRDSSILLRFFYKTFYRVMTAMSEHHWPVDAGDFCVMSGRCVQAITLLPEHVRMMRGIRSWIGYQQIGVPYDRPPRAAGVSHYNFARLSRLALDAIVGFSTAPLRLASFLGIAVGIMSMIFGVVFLVSRLMPDIFPFGYKIGITPGIATLAIGGAFLGSAILICLGILGEYVAVLVREVKRRPSAIVAEVIGVGFEV